MKLHKRILSTLLVAGMVASLTACGMFKENYKVPEFSEDDVIYRSAWWCPEPTDENYNTYLESGLNTIYLMNHNYLDTLDADMATTGKSAEDITYESGYFLGTSDKYDCETMTEKALALAKEKGLYVYLAEGNYLYDWIGSDINVYDEFNIDYSDYEDTIIGLFSGDEPTEPQIHDLAEMIPAAEKAVPNVPYFCNLFPSYANLEEVLMVDKYTDYADSLCTNFLEKQSGPLMISVDYYPFQADFFKNWAYNYDALIRRAHKYDAAFHTFIQTYVDAEGLVTPVTEQDVRLQVNTSLAYGSERFSYFLYETAPGPMLTGLMDINGNKTNMYSFAQTVNKEVAALEHAYMHYDHVWTAPLYDTVSNYFGELSPLANTYEQNLAECNVLTDVQTNNCTLVSLFKDEDGNEAYYIVNFYEDRADAPGEDCTVTLSFEKMKKVSLYGSTNLYEGETVKLDDSSYTFTLAPGDGIFVVPSKR